MSKKNLQISKFITPGDYLAVVVVLIGIITAIYFEEIAIRMIGVSVAILGAVALFMLISQRSSEIVESRFHNRSENQPEFKMTTTKDATAKRQTVEDFGDSFGSDDDFPIPESKISMPEKTTNIIDTQVINKIDNDIEELSFNDGFSGMRIVGKVKPKYSESQISSENETVIKIEEVKNPIIETLKEDVKIQESVTSEIKKIEENTSGQEVLEAIKPKTSDKIGIFDEISDSSEVKIPDLSSARVLIETKQSENDSKYRGKVIDLPLNILRDTDILIGDEPKKEFEYFLHRVLTIIRSSTDTRTATFFLFNSKKQELILESFITTIPQKIRQNLKFNLANDIISQIISNQKPQILSEINPAAEIDIIPYYNESCNTRSIIGVPVFWGDGIVGILMADSESPNAYDSATVAFLGHFTKLIAAIVMSYMRKFDLLKSSKTLEAINMFYSYSANSAEDHSISDKIVNTLKNLFPNSNVGLCAFDSEKDNWIIKSFKGEGKDLTNTEINIEDSIIGKSIYNCKTYIVKTDNEQDLARIYPEESKLRGQFISSPIKSASQIYGAIYVELTSNDILSEFDIYIIELIGDHAGNNIERIYLSETINSTAIYDFNTGLINPIAFYDRINEELNRAIDFKTPLTLCLFKFDRYTPLDPERYPERFEFVAHLILQRIRAYLKPYDIYGNVSEGMYGIVFVGKDSNQAKLSAERIRAEVAKTIIEHSGGKFSTTLSMGLCSPTKNSNIDSLIRDTMTSLDKAVEVGNQVQVLY